MLAIIHTWRSEFNFGVASFPAELVKPAQFLFLKLLLYDSGATCIQAWAICTHCCLDLSHTLTYHNCSLRTLWIKRDFCMNFLSGAKSKNVLLQMA